MSTHRTAPLATPGMPPGIPYIIGNEVAERFSFYGMRSILTIFMTSHLLMQEGTATEWFHLFVLAVYFTPLLGAILADRWLGKFRTIMTLSVVYCLGHLALALDDSRNGLLLGLGLIAVGSGGIKGCVSAHVGDQFGASNARLLPRIYSWFYFSINLGSAVATVLIPVILAKWGPHWAFGIPGVLMALATILFWIGRNDYAHIPPRGKAVWRETFSPEGLRAVGRMAVIFVFVAAFWALFDQTGSRWVIQGAKMDRTLFGFTLNASSLQAANPLMVMALIPLCSFVIYPWLHRVWGLTPLRKIGLGFFIAVPSFLIPAWIESQITAGGTPSILWQVAAYFFITLAEVMISITALEFSYTQAPKSGKSLMLGLNYASVSLGNGFTFLVNVFGASRLEGPAYFLFFAGIMALAAVVFVVVAMRFQPRDILQDEVVAEELPKSGLT
ncbi:MAG: POT family MFS transporter [Verrucomicrobiota bacterium]